MRYVVSDTRVSTGDLFLYHKTTRRDLYDREWKHYADTLGSDEVIYLNERGELAEGSRTTIFVEMDGVLATPALAAGLLPGTLRAELIAQGRAREMRLTLDDLSRADAVYLEIRCGAWSRLNRLFPRQFSILQIKIDRSAVKHAARDSTRWRRLGPYRAVELISAQLGRAVRIQHRSDCSCRQGNCKRDGGCRKARTPGKCV